MATGRELFIKLLRGEPLSRPAYVPLVRGLAARVGGLSRETLNSDPTLWANSLMKTAELLDLDGVVIGFDFTLMAEACGCKVIWKNDRPVILAPSAGLCETPEENGRMKNALEAAKRVFQVCRDQRACVSSITGPMTLATQLFGHEEGAKHLGESKQLVVRVAEAFCQTRPDVLIFMEGRPLALTELNLTHRRIYNTLKNIASYYNLPAALYLQGYQPQNLAQFSSLRMDIYILGPSIDRNLPPLSEIWALGVGALGVGLSLPLDDLEKAKEIISEGLSLYKTQGKQSFFFTSFGPVTRDVDIETLQQLIKEISRIRL